MKTIKSYTIIVLMLCLPIQAQQGIIELNTVYTGTHAFVASEAVILSPGFQYNPSSGNYFLARTEAAEISPIKYLSENQIIDPDTRTLDPSLPVGAIPGTFNVSPLGAATYQIPIFAAPGTNDLMPSISVIYNSHGGNGLLGYGFELAGLSSIARVKKPFNINTISEGITLTNNDGLALDGNYLVLKTGTFGINGSTYVTENETFSLITLHGNLDAPTSWFEATLKNGNRIEYGNQVYSTITTEDDLIVFTWNITKITDRLDNYIIFEYDYDQSSKQKVLKCIKYTGNSNTGLQPYNALYFSYQARSDENEMYLKNNIEGTDYSVIVPNKLLIKSIQSMSEGKIRRTFSFNYSFISFSHLNEIIEADEDNIPLNSTLFKWGTRGLAGVAETLSQAELPQESYMNHYHLYPGDFNGDGKEDYIAYCPKEFWITDPDTWVLFINQGDNFALAASGQIDDDNFKKFTICDVDNDGDDDVLWETTEGIGSYKKYILKAYLFQNNGLVRTSSLDHSCYVDYDLVDIHVVSGDFNGDGKTDFMFLDEENDLHGSSGFVFDNFLFPDLGQSDQMLFADFNGNGKSDIINSYNGVVSIYEFGGRFEDGFEQIANITISSDLVNLYSGDFNGDYKSDLLLYDVDYPSFSQILYSNGRDYVATTFDFAREPDEGEVLQYLTSDFNRDGLSDILEIEILPDPNVSDFSSVYGITIEKLFLSTGTKFNEIPITGLAETGSSYKLFYNTIDNNSDGIPDIKIDHGLNCYDWNILPDYLENSVVSVTNGLGLQKQVEYKFITDMDVYTNTYPSYTYPVKPYNKPLQVVYNYKTYDLVNSKAISEVEMHYNNLKMHSRGKGLLGFSNVSALNHTTQIVSTTDYNFDPVFYNVFATKTMNYSGGHYTSKIDYLNTTEPLDGGERFFSYTAKTTISNYAKGTQNEIYIVLDGFGNIVNRSTKDNTLAGITILQTEETFSGFNAFGDPADIVVSKSYNGNSTSRSCTRLFYPNGLISNEVKHLGVSSTVETSYTYDSYGNVLTNTTTIGSISRTLTFTYEELYGRYLKSKEDHLGNTSRYFYNTPTGELIQRTDQFENTGPITNTFFEYDGFGNLVKTTYSDLQVKNESTFLSINETGLGDVYCKKIQMSGHPTQMTYYDIEGKELRNKKSSFNGTYIVTDTEYNIKGQVSKKYLPRFEGESGTQYVTYSYDDYGNVAMETLYPSGVSVTYATQGLITTMIKPNKTYITEYNAAGMKIKTTDPGGVINYEYNPDGEVISIISPSGTTTIDYDDFGNQTRLVDLDAGERNYTYNGFGELTGQTDANNNQVTFIYDNAGKLLTETWNNGFAKTYSYNSATGLLEKLSSSDGHEISYSYDNLGRRTGITQKFDNENVFTKTFAYNAFGNLYSVITNSKIYEALLYNSYGYQSQHLVNGTVVWKAVTQNKNGIISNYKLRNENESAYLYFDSNGFPSSISYTNTSGLIEAWSYNFSPSTGNMTSRLQYTGGSSTLQETFLYDNQDRLTDYTVVNGTHYNISYDASGNGNITGKTDVGIYNYGDAVHAPSFISESTQLISSLPEQEITYTHFNKVKTLVVTGDSIPEESLELSYWPDNERAQQIYAIGDVPTSTKYYAFGSYEKEITLGSTRELYYINTPSGTVAVAEVQSGVTNLYYIHKDILGSFDVITSSSGAIVERNSFDPWGRRRNVTNWTYDNVSNTLFTGRGFTGHEHLLNFELINMNGRVYDPILAMFLSPDNFIQAPELTNGFNRYSYCMNNPLIYADPSGDLGIFAQILLGAGLNYIMTWLNNVLGYGMTPAQAFRNSPIVFMYSGSFSFGGSQKNDISAFYTYSSSSGDYYDSYFTSDYLMEDEFFGNWGDMYKESSGGMSYDPSGLLASEQENDRSNVLYSIGRESYYKKYFKYMLGEGVAFGATLMVRGVVNISQVNGVYYANVSASAFTPASQKGTVLYNGLVEVMDGHNVVSTHKLISYLGPYFDHKGFGWVNVGQVRITLPSHGLDAIYLRYNVSYTYSEGVGSLAPWPANSYYKLLIGLVIDAFSY